MNPAVRAVDRPPPYPPKEPVAPRSRPTASITTKESVPPSVVTPPPPPAPTPWWAWFALAALVVVALVVVALVTRDAGMVQATGTAIAQAVVRPI